ncbi:thermolabile L-asparaginase [Aspergillus ellipticus CBS 707.79]|uniref:Thermolabile L-asparaginase n=1 Tax=Aspergillus ellipticus CBS 707.79 TaxID=1448320 RepID=A0A319D041_9EURO|nr:thermolabile L-asparaginase [Aspergillus ellipticus CBS 707.79]
MPTHLNPQENLVLTDRAGVIENSHIIHAAIVDFAPTNENKTKTTLLFAVGNPHRITLARSAAKPIQTLAILETGAGQRYGFDDADVAPMCASHSSEGRHVARARGMVCKVNGYLDLDLGKTDLKCGGHAALSETVNRAWIREGFVPTAMYNNCSGKHVGMVAGARALGLGLGDGGGDWREYHLSNHPMQVRVRRVFGEVCGLGSGELRWGLDGCDLPAPACSLVRLGGMYARLAGAADTEMGAGVSETDAEQSRTRYLHRIFHAMARYPEYVGGEGRFCTELARTFQGGGGGLIGKLGADGCYGLAIRESEQTRRLGTRGAIGVAVKVEDGSIDILYAAVMEILEQLQIGTQEMRDALGRFHRPKICNTVGAVTGQVSPLFRVRAV